MDKEKLEKIRKRLHEIIYEADTREGKLFDLVLIGVILLSIISVMLESIASVKIVYGTFLKVIEWIITIAFTIEYIGRIFALKRPGKYIFSAYGIIDLLATLPTYIDLIFPGMHFLVSIRAIRFLRIFRILKLTRYVGASNQLVLALLKSRLKIAVFLFNVVILCIILGTIMYMVEGPNSGFTSIPKSIYWTIVTLTTVGFGDITPVTALGQFIAMIIMIVGYGIIAVPTGLITAEFMSREKNVHDNTQVCPSCGADHHKNKATFCYKCGHELNE